MHLRLRPSASGASITDVRARLPQTTCTRVSRSRRPFAIPSSQRQ